MVLPSAAFALKDSDSHIRHGYTAVTWGNADQQAINDISAVGYPGIQFRIEATTELYALFIPKTAQTISLATHQNSQLLR